MALQNPGITQSAVVKNVKSGVILGGLSVLRWLHYLLLVLMKNIRVWSIHRNGKMGKLHEVMKEV